MLPIQLINLAEGFIKHYDAENPTLTQFRGIRNSVLGSYAARGFHCWQNGAMVQIGDQLRLFVVKKGRFLLDKLQEILISADIEVYPELSTDLKAYLNIQLNQSIEAAKNYIEQMRCEANAPTGTTIETLASLQNVLFGLHAEVDLFCTKYSTKKKNQTVATNSVNIEHFTGVYGDVVNSQVTVYDYSSIYKMLKEKGVPQIARNQIENLMDELKIAAPEKRPPLVDQAKDWILHNKELLGAGAEIVAKAIGMAKAN